MKSSIQNDYDQLCVASEYVNQFLERKKAINDHGIINELIQADIDYDNQLSKLDKLSYLTSITEDTLFDVYNDIINRSHNRVFIDFT